MPAVSIPVLSLFCGCGGMDLGFRRQGFVPVLALDTGHAALQSYNWNGKHKAIFLMLRTEATAP